MAGISAPVQILSAPGVTVANALNYATKGTYAGKLIILTAIMGILSSWNGFMIGATRVLFSMGRAGMLPPIFVNASSEIQDAVFRNCICGDRHHARSAFRKKLLGLVCRRQLFWNGNRLFHGGNLIHGINPSLSVQRTSRARKPSNIKGLRVLGAVLRL